MRPEPQAGTAAYGLLKHLYVAARVGRVAVEAGGDYGFDCEFVVPAACFLHVEIEIGGIDAVADLLATRIEVGVLSKEGGGVV